MGSDSELKRLKKENRYLKKKLYRLEARESTEHDDEVGSDCYGAGNYFSFLLKKMRSKSGFSTFEKYFRNSMLVTKIFRIGLLIYQYLQAGAFMLLYTAAFILVIPAILAAAALTLVITLILRSRNARLLLSLAKKDIVFITVAGKERFSRMRIRQAAAMYTGSTVLVVSPYFLSRRGVGENDKMYVCFRHEYDNVYIMRDYFFFYFRRRLQKLQNHNITEVTSLGSAADGGRTEN